MKTMTISHEDDERKKEKPVVMSFNEFQPMRSTTGINSPKLEESSKTGLDNFPAWPNGFPVGTRGSTRHSKGQIQNFVKFNIA